MIVQLRLTTIAFFSLYPKQATRVKLEFLSLRKAGYQVRMVTPHSFSYLPGLLRLLFVYLHFFLLTLTVKADIYHYSNIPDFQAMSFLLRKKAVFVYDIRSMFSSNIYEYTRNMFLYKIIYSIEKKLTRRANYVITANSLLAKRAWRMGARKAKSVPNYPLIKMNIKIPKDKLRGDLGAAEDDTVYLLISTLSPQKPFDLLVSSFERLYSQNPNIKLWIIGDGKDRKRLEKIADKDLCTFLGYKAVTELGSYINASDVCLALYNQYNKIPRFYSVESVWKVGEYALFDKPIVALNMIPHDGLINANEDNFIEKMVEAKDSKTRLQPHYWSESHDKLVQIYSELTNQSS